MKHINNFDDYISEAYLKGSKQPLYHVTRNLEAILETDYLKISKPAYGYGDKKSISVTRSNIYSAQDSYDGFSGHRLVLNTDKLLLAGYRSYPVDEIGIAASGGGKRKTQKNIQKWNYLFRKPVTGKNLNLPTPENDIELEIEYEERFYKEIKDLGKFLLAIEFRTLETFEYFIRRNLNALISYLNKYPHIKFHYYVNNAWDRPIEINIEKYIKQEDENIVNKNI